MSKVSIIIINYNDKLRIERAINSAVNQTWQDKEIIVVDDGSDNETREIYRKYLGGDMVYDKTDPLEEYETVGNLTLVSLKREDNSARTPSRARNAGIAAATGDYICFLDSDNYYEKTFVEDLIKMDADCAFCNWEIFGKENYKVDIEKVWKENDVLMNYLRYTHLDHQCILFKKEYFDKVVGKYDERLPRSQDCDVIVRAMLGKGSWKHHSNCLFKFEKHEDDQMKVIASIHGKMLWTLKNDLNPIWLVNQLQNPDMWVVFNQAITDFCAKPEWEEDYKKSTFFKRRKGVLSRLNQEIIEKI